MVSKLFFHDPPSFWFLCYTFRSTARCATVNAGTRSRGPYRINQNKIIIAVQTCTRLPQQMNWTKIRFTPIMDHGYDMFQTAPIDIIRSQTRNCSDKRVQGHVTVHHHTNHQTCHHWLQTLIQRTPQAIIQWAKIFSKVRQGDQIDQGYRRKSTNLSFSKDSRSFLSKASKRGSSLQTLLKLSYVVACEISCIKQNIHIWV